MVPRFVSTLQDVDTVRCIQLKRAVSSLCRAYNSLCIAVELFRTPEKQLSLWRWDQIPGRQCHLYWRIGTARVRVFVDFWWSWRSLGQFRAAVGWGMECVRAGCAHLWAVGSVWVVRFEFSLVTPPGRSGRLGMPISEYVSSVCLSITHAKNDIFLWWGDGLGEPVVCHHWLEPVLVGFPSNPRQKPVSHLWVG